MRIIAGEWGGRRLKPLKAAGVRPTTDRVRESWMGALGSDVQDARVLDLFAGSGGLGLEALSRGARETVFVERARGALECLRGNIDLLNAQDRCKVVRADALKYVVSLDGRAFDLALADPPYDRGFAGRLLEAFARQPFARELWVEHRSREALPDIPGLRHRRYGDTTLTILAAVLEPI